MIKKIISSVLTILLLMNSSVAFSKNTIKPQISIKPAVNNLISIFSEQPIPNSSFLISINKDYKIASTKSSTIKRKYMISQTKLLTLTGKNNAKGYIKLIRNQIDKDNLYTVEASINKKESSLFEIHLASGEKIPLSNTLYAEHEKEDFWIGGAYYAKDIANHLKQISAILISSIVNTNTGIINIKVPVKSTAKTNLYFMSSNGKLFSDNDYTKSCISNFNFNNKYIINDEGIYTHEMGLYTPFSKDYYWLTPSALMIRACTWDNSKDKFFKNLCIYLTYKYLDLYNKKGFIPSSVECERLKKNFNIGKDFFDTRFNSDTISSLIRAYQLYPDDEIKQKINKYFKYYLWYFDNNSFRVNNMMFPPDYSDGSDIYTSNIPDASLNHMLAELQNLYDWYYITRDQKLLDTAHILKRSLIYIGGRWIKSNDDLWYSIDTKGNLLKNDYPLVTLNDLKSIKQSIIKVDGTFPVEFQNMIDAKTKFARSKGYI